MTIKAKFDGSFNKSKMYSWIFIKGVMVILNEDTFNVTIKESYIHKPSYEIGINKIRKRKK